jgi:hypothetical protein
LCLNWSRFTKSKFSEKVQETVRYVLHGQKYTVTWFLT